MEKQQLQTRTNVLMGLVSLLGCGLFFMVLFILHKIDILPWIIWFSAFFLCCMASIFSVIILLAVGFSSLPIWNYLHKLLIHLIPEEKSTTTTITIELSDKKNGSFLVFICLAAFMVSGLSLFSIGWNIHAYYISAGTGIVKEITWKSILILENKQSISNPVNNYEIFSELKPIELGDHIHKKRGSTIFFVNNKNYFDKKMIWKQVLNSDFIIFFIIATSLGILTATIFKICYPEELLDLLNY